MMSIKNLLEKYNIEPKSYPDFSYRFTLAEQLKKADKGLIIVGNTRSGKSTIFSGLAGSSLKNVYDQSEKKVFVEPEDQKFRSYVKTNYHTSHTEVPNVEMVLEGGKEFAYVDMPGYADNDPFRELINFVYIRTMIQNLKNVSFLLVITITPKGDNYQLPEHEIKMMESFMDMFENCSDYIQIAVNKVQKTDDIHYAETKIRQCIRKAIQDHKDDNFKRFYSTISPQKIHILKRTIYNLNRSHHYHLPGQILALPKTAQYIQMSKIQYNRPSLVQRGNQEAKKQFDKKISEEYLRGSFKQIQSIYKLMKKVYMIALISSVNKQTKQIKTQKLKEALDCYDQQKFKSENKKCDYSCKTEQMKQILKLSNFQSTLIGWFVKIMKPTSDIFDKDVAKYYQRQEETLIDYLLFCKKILHFLMDSSYQAEISTKISQMMLNAHRKYKQIVFLLTSIDIENITEHSINIHVMFTNFQQENSPLQSIDSVKFYSALLKFSQMLLNRQDQQQCSVENKNELIRMYENLKLLYESVEKGARASKQQIQQVKWTSLINSKIQKIEYSYLLNTNFDQIAPLDCQNQVLLTLSRYKPNDDIKIKLVEKLADLNHKKFHNFETAVKLYLLLTRYAVAFQIVKTHCSNFSYESLMNIGNEFAQNRREYALECYERAIQIDYNNHENWKKAEMKINQMNAKQNEYIQRRKQELSNVNGSSYIDFNKINNIQSYIDFKVKQNPEQKLTNLKGSFTPSRSIRMSQMTFTKSS